MTVGLLEDKERCEQKRTVKITTGQVFAQIRTYKNVDFTELPPRPRYRSLQHRFEGVVEMASSTAALEETNGLSEGHQDGATPADLRRFG